VLSFSDHKTNDEEAILTVLVVLLAIILRLSLSLSATAKWAEI